MKLDYTLPDEAAAQTGCQTLIDEPMKKHTTFQIGGPADRLYTAGNQRQLSGLLSALREGEIPFFLLGNGSDLLVADEGFRGAAVVLSGEFGKAELLPGNRLRSGAGVPLARLCALAREQGLSGLEFAWGIPGSVGGAVYMNAGAYGGEMKDVVYRVLHMTPQGAVEEAEGEALSFSYRKSRYTGTGEIVLFAQVQLTPGSGAEISSKMEELMRRRKEKQPYDMPSAGSVFKRPQGGFAAALIEECGLKGASLGGAQVSPKHAGFIVNTGGASCSDVLGLIERIRETVLREKGIELECEVRVIR